MTARKADKRLIAVLIVFCGLILPHVLISVSGSSRAQSRPWTMAILFVSASVTFCWLGLDPRLSLLSESALLSQQQYDAVRPRVVRMMRLFCVGFGMLVFALLAVPFVAATVRITRGEKPISIVGKVEKNSSPSFGAWYFEQSVTLFPAGGQYELFYSLVPLQVGETYELRVLPNSKLVLDFQKVS